MRLVRIGLPRRERSTAASRVAGIRSRGVLRRARRHAWLVLTLALAALVVIAIAENTNAAGSFGLAAGYLSEGPGLVRTVQASWRVPSVRGGSSTAEALTWIGAQAGFGNSIPFVQVGTWEYSSGDYAAFWSDTDHQFRPVFMGVVNPGDLVSARLARTHRGWLITFRDLTTNADETAIGTDGHDARFDLAEWIQEDPKDLATGQPLPYPELSDVRFRRLLLNGSPPRYANLYSQWLSLPGARSIGPTPLRRDQFSLRPTSVSRTGDQYLSDAASLNDAYDSFLSESERWTLRTSRAQAATQARALVSASTAEDRNLAAQDWPPVVRTEISELVAREMVVIADLQLVGHITPGHRAAWMSRLMHDIQAHRDVEHRICRALRIPEYVP